jgi:hypothetical protein
LIGHSGDVQMTRLRSPSVSQGAIEQRYKLFRIPYVSLLHQLAELAQECRNVWFCRGLPPLPELP